MINSRDKMKKRRTNKVSYREATLLFFLNFFCQFLWNVLFLMYPIIFWCHCKWQFCVLVCGWPGEGYVDGQGRVMQELFRERGEDEWNFFVDLHDSISFHIYLFSSLKGKGGGFLKSKKPLFIELLFSIVNSIYQFCGLIGEFGMWFLLTFFFKSRFTKYLIYFFV